MTTTAAAAAVARVPAGRWAVGVSGGADSVALLVLLCEHRADDVALHVAHLDHETRGGASAADARFVAELANRLSLPCTVKRRSDVESTLDVLEPNPSARFRAARLALFRDVVDSNRLDGVLLAHHAGDQAETVLHRLLRGSGPAGLGGMSPSACVGGLVIVRPLLDVPGEELRDVLTSRGQAWREDATNASDIYLRNRLRRVLSGRPALCDALVGLARACGTVREWVRANTPAPSEMLRTDELLACPPPIRRELARAWLTGVGVTPGSVDSGVIRRLIAMAEDAATPGRQMFPGGIRVRRARGMLMAEGEK